MTPILFAFSQNRVMLSCMIITLVAALALTGAKVEEAEAGKTWHVTVDAVPKTVDEFIALRDVIATSPQGGIAAFLVAAIMYGENEAAGEQAIIAALDASNLIDAKSGLQAKRPEYKGFKVGNSM